MTEHVEGFTARDLTGKLREAGFEVLVEQTGGGTATIYATRAGITIAGGPGAYNWQDAEGSTFDTAEFYVGPEEDYYNVQAARDGASMETIAALFASVAPE